MCGSFGICGLVPLSLQSAHVAGLGEACREAATRTFFHLSPPGSGEEVRRTQSPSLLRRGTLRKGGRLYPARTLALGVNACRRCTLNNTPRSTCPGIRGVFWQPSTFKYHRIWQNLGNAMNQCNLLAVHLPTQFATALQLLAKLLITSHLSSSSHLPWIPRLHAFVA